MYIKTKGKRLTHRHGLSENADICKGNKKRTNLHRMFYLLHELASTGYIDSIATDLFKSINRLAYDEDKDTKEGK